MKSRYSNRKSYISFLIFLIFVIGQSVFSQVTYYSQGTQPFGTLSNWDTDRPGANNAPPTDFVQGDIFVIQTGNVVTLDNVSTAIQDLTIESGGTFDNGLYSIVFGVAGGTLDIQSGGIYTASSGTIEHQAGVLNTVTIQANATAITLNNVITNGRLTFNHTGGTTCVYTFNGTFTVNTGQTITTTSSSIAYNSTTGTLRYGTSRIATTTEWPAGGVPNLILQSGPVTISSGTYEVDSKLTRINGSLSVSGTFQYDSGNETTLEYAPSPAAAVTIGAEWPGANGPSNVTVNNSGQIVTSGAVRTIAKTLSMTTGTLAMGSNNLTLLGSLVGGDLADGGTITSSGTIQMGNGSTTPQEDQTISGAVTLSNLTINKATTNNNLTITGSPTISSGLTLTAGDVSVDGGSVTITAGGYTQTAGIVNLINSGSFTVTAGDLTVNSGTFTNTGGTVTVTNVSNMIYVATGATFAMSTGANSITTNEIQLTGTGRYQTGGKTINSLTTLTLASTSTFEFDGSTKETTPSGYTFGNLEMNNPGGLDIAGNTTIDGILTFSQDATVNVSGANILTLGTGASISGVSSSRYVDGPLRKAFTGGNISFTFPVGNSSYIPATFEYLTNNVGTSVIEVAGNSGDPGGTGPAGISQIATSHYYTVIERGTGGAFTYNFTGIHTGSGFVPSSRNRLIVQTGTSPETYTYPNAIAQTVGTDTVKINDALGTLPTDAGIIAIGSGQSTVTWDGDAGSDNDWSTPSNWDNDVVPQIGDIVVFDGSLSDDVIYDTDVTQTSFASITISGASAVSVTLTKNTTLTLTASPNALVVGDNGTFIFNGTTLDFGSGYDNGLTDFQLGSTVQYNSTFSGGIQADTYGNLTQNTGGSASLLGTIVLAQDGTYSSTLLVQSGSLYLASQTITLTDGGGSHILDVDASQSLYTANVSGTGSGSTLGGFDTYNLDGTIVYNGNSTETMTSAITSLENLTINNSANVTMGANLQILGNLDFDAGRLNASSFTLTLGASGTITGASSTRYVNGNLTKVFGSTGSFTYEIGDASAASADDRYRAVDINVTSLDGASNSINVIYLEDDPAVSTLPTDIKSASNSRKWTITESGARTPTLSLTLNYTNPGFTVTNHDMVRILRGNDGSDNYAIVQGGSTTSNGSDEVTATGITLSGLTDYTLAEMQGTYTWDGSESTAWETDGNWVQGEAPAQGDAVVLNETGNATDYTVNITSAVTIDDIQITPTGSQFISLVIGSGGSMTLEGSGTVLTVNIRGTLAINGPSGNGVSAGSSNITFASGATYDLTTGTGISTSGSRTMTGSTTNIASTTSGALKAITYGDLNITNISGTQTVTGNVTCAAFTMDDAGHATINGNFTINGSLTKNSGAGTLTVNGGELQVSGAISCQAGTITSTGSGGFVDANSTITNNGGTINFAGTSASDVDGAFTNTSGTVNFTGSGALNFDGAYDGVGTLNAASGSGTVTFVSTFGPDGNATFGSQMLALQGGVNIGGGTFTPSTATNFTGSPLFQTSGSGTVSNSAGKITFTGTGAQGITDGSSAGLEFNDVEINKGANNVTLNDPVTIYGTLTLTDGNIITAGSNIPTLDVGASVTSGSANSFIEGPLARETNSSATIYSFPVGDNGYWRPLDMRPTASTPETFTAEFISTDPTVAFGTNYTGLHHVSELYYWTLTRPGSVNARVTLHWKSAYDGVESGHEDEIVVAQWDGSSWQNRGLAGNYDGDYLLGSIGSSPITTWTNTQFTLGTTTLDNPLPVELISFEAEGNFKDVNLTWTTASEIENLGFNIYRSIKDEDVWSKVNDYIIAGQGNTSDETVYEYSDKNIVLGESYSYKLESLSISGVIEVHNPVYVTVPVPKAYALFNNYPNPFNPTTNLKFQLPVQSEVSVTIYDIQGHVVKKLLKKATYTTGEHEAQWDATDDFGKKVATGMYVYRFTAGSYQKLGKMILIK